MPFRQMNHQGMKSLLIVKTKLYNNYRLFENSSKPRREKVKIERTAKVSQLEK